MLNFEEFKDYVLEHIREYLPEYLSDADVRMHTVPKNNGVELSGIMVGAKDSKVAPTIYLEEYYLEYLRDGRIMSVMEEIAEVCSARQNYDKILNAVELFKDFECVKDNLIMVAVNAKSNKKMLEDTPHVLKEDLALIYKVIVENSRYSLGTITVKNQHMDMWGTDINTLDALARENSKKLMPAVIKDMKDVLMELMLKNMPEDMDGLPEDMDKLLEECIPKEHRMYVISNEYRNNGAGVLFYDEDAIAEFANKLESDLYILPSSIHETIAVSADVWEPERLARMVQEVNRNEVQLEEQLSNNVYHYSAATRTLSLADVQAPELLKEHEVNRFKRSR